MKKHISGYKLNMDSARRLALMKSLVSELIRHEEITTTKTKAKAVTPIFEKLLTRARLDSIQNRRMIQGYVQDNELVKKLFVSIAPRYKAVLGGYTKLTQVANRRGDNAPTVRLALTKKVSEAVTKETVKTADKKPIKSKGKIAKIRGIAPEKTQATKEAPKLVRRTGKRGDK